jgi:Ca2+-binding RTX toxin-like protein
MTTHSFTGFSVTRDGLGAVTGVTTSSMAWTTSEIFRFRYTMDAPVAGSVSSITTKINEAAGYSLDGVTINGTQRVFLDDVASIGQFTWNNGTANVKSTLLLIETAPGVTHYYHLGGAAIPVVTNLAGFAAFSAAISGLTSVITSTSVSAAAPPNYNIPVTQMSGYLGASETDLFIGVTGVDDWSTAPLQTGEGSDTVQGTDNTDWVEGGALQDFLNGNGGDDRLFGQDGNDQLFGGLGNDSLYGGLGNDVMEGADGNDFMLGGSGVDQMTGGLGLDSMKGDGGGDTMDGGDGADTMSGGTGDDLMYGGADNDVLRGDSGLDTIYGGDGNDRVLGGDGNDVLYGDVGNDFVDGGLGNDEIEGGAGSDTLIGNSGADTILGGNGADSITGGSGDDAIDGGDGNDVIDGGGQNDAVNGGLGADTIRGGSGNDSLSGDEGNDVLYGGTGEDQFYFIAGGGSDTVMDFRLDQFDELHFSNGLGLDAAGVFATAAQDGTNVVFDLGADGIVTVRNVSLDAIENSIFIWDEFASTGG